MLDDLIKYIPVLEDCEDDLYMSDKFCKKRKNQDKETNHIYDHIISYHINWDYPSPHRTFIAKYGVSSACADFDH